MGAHPRKGKLAAVTYPTVTENRLKLEATAHDTFADGLRVPALAVVVPLASATAPRLAAVGAKAA